MTTIILKPHKEESLKRFHPWVFSGAIERVVLDKNYPYDQPQEGEVVLVTAHDGQTLGVGHYQVGSIAVRILEFGVSQLPKDFYPKRIAAAYQLRQALGLTMVHGTSSNGKCNNTYRLVHGEGDFLPGLVIDIYNDTAVMQAHSVGMHLVRAEIAQAVTDTIPEVKAVYYKSDDTLPFKANIPQEEKVGYLRPIPGPSLIGQGDTNNKEFWSAENGLEFRIDWLRGQKTGFFVDQRENRALLEKYAAGRDVLNMFCYTGGFSVYALRGGAKMVHSVDVSEKAVELVRTNVERNFPNCQRHEAFAEEAFKFMADIKDKYDLIILDPPAFAKHRDAIKNALRGYQRINQKAIEQIRPGGILFTFSCSQAIDKEMFRLAVFSAAAAVGRKVRILHQLHQPQDHPINIYHPEGEYLKGLVLQVE
ncbi:MAG: class I SAM-dependent rRNA methyltransferase [Paludibacteraceae bacterium]|nr:class I SAM-dependent rRNA methyltransferase [Paludibacteraceae bacterium]